MLCASRHHLRPGSRVCRRFEVMLIGLAGCGKTQSCTGLLKKLDREAGTIVPAVDRAGLRPVDSVTWLWVVGIYQMLIVTHVRAKVKLSGGDSFSGA